MLEAVRILARVGAVLTFELRACPRHDALVEVAAAESGVAVRGQDRQVVARDAQDGDVEGAAAEVVNDRDMGRGGGYGAGYGAGYGDDYGSYGGGYAAGYGGVYDGYGGVSYGAR